MKVVLVPEGASTKVGPWITIMALMAAVDPVVEPTAMTPATPAVLPVIVVVTWLAAVWTAIQPGAMAAVVVIKALVSFTNTLVSQMFDMTLVVVFTVAIHSIGAVALKAGTPAISVV